MSKRPVVTVALVGGPTATKLGEISGWSEAEYARRDAVLAGLGITMGRRRKTADNS